MMDNKHTGALLLCAAGLVTAIGAAGAQIAAALVLGGFYAGNMSGEVPAGPESANLHWLVIVTTVVLAAIGLFYLFRPSSKT